MEKSKVLRSRTLATSMIMVFAEIGAVVSFCGALFILPLDLLLRSVLPDTIAATHPIYCVYSLALCTLVLSGLLPYYGAINKELRSSLLGTSIGVFIPQMFFCSIMYGPQIGMIAAGASVITFALPVAIAWIYTLRSTRALPLVM